MLCPPFTTMVLRCENVIKSGLIWAINRQSKDKYKSDNLWNVCFNQPRPCLKILNISTWAYKCTGLLSNFN